MSKALLLVFLVVAASRSIAQEPLPTIQTTFYAFRYAPEFKSIYLRTGEKSFEELQLSTANLIGPQKSVVTDGRVTLHKMTTLEDGSVAYPVIGTAKIRSGMSKVLIVLAPVASPDSKHAYQTLVIDHQDAKFPRGSYKMVNMSPHPIRGAIGKGTRFTCDPGKVAEFKTKGTPGEALPVLFQYQDDKRWRTLTETRWAHSKDGRSLLCAYRDNSTKRMKLRSIPDNTRKAAP